MRSIFLRREIQFFQLNLDENYWTHFLNFMYKIHDISFHTFWKKTIGLSHTPAQDCLFSPSEINIFNVSL